MVKLPSYEWFMGQLAFRGQGNVYTGSFSPNHELSGIDKDCFRYRVCIDKDKEDNRILKAAYYNGPYCYEATDKNIITKKDFEASEKGVSEAQEWIIETINAQ